MKNEKDVYTKGMAAWQEEDDANWENYSNWQFKLLKPFIGNRILEIGPGQGRMTTLITKERSFHRYVAVEPSSHFIEVLSKKFPNIEVLNTTSDKLDNTYNSAFDTILLVHLLEHIEDDRKFLEDLKRFLVPDGKIIILVPALNYLMSDLDIKIGHYRRYDKTMIKDLARLSGYRITANRYDNLIGLFGWLIFCKLRKYDYQSTQKKTKLMNLFKFYDTCILPISSLAERLIPPPIGLGLLAVLENSSKTLR